MQFKKNMLVVSMLIFLASCAMGPNYKRPTVEVPTKYKEAKKQWKLAKPNDAYDRGEWWKIFHDTQLNNLEAELTISNQNIMVAAAQYMQAQALVDAASASFLPTFGVAATAQRQKQVTIGGSSFLVSNGPTSSNSISGSSGGSAITSNVTTSHALNFTASWVPDLWGSISRNVEANRANAEALSAQLALARLSAQATLAQTYFQLRALDTDQKLLDSTVNDYQNALKLTQNQYTAGTAQQSDVLQARSQLESAKALALNNKISRAQLEHAIAVLIGKPPADFSIKQKPLNATPPAIPLEAPSALLERRPDVARAERKMAQANAQIGVAVAAYFPAMTLSGSGNVQNTGLGYWFSIPAMGWTIGAQLGETILDGGLRSANIRAAKANYYSVVASYRQTVLAAFQNVEDNLVALRILKEQSLVQDKAAYDAKEALRIMMNQYKAGIVPYSSVITAQITAFSAEKSAADVKGLRMSAAVQLIQALGGSWN